MQRTKTNQQARTNQSANEPFALLIEQHRQVEQLFKQIMGTSAQDEERRRDLFKQLNKDLSMHADLEEAHLYPILEEAGETHDLALEAEEEHHAVKVMLKELSLMSFVGQADNEKWIAKMKVLQENVMHHVEEEEGEMFQKARAALSDQQLEQMQIAMEEFMRDQR